MVNQLYTSTINKPGWTRTGITLRDTPGNHAVVVTKISPQSDFHLQGTPLRAKQMILTINGVSSKGRTASDLSQLILSASGKLQIVSTGVPPGAMAGGLWGYQKYATGHQFRAVAIQYIRLYRSPDRYWYLEDGRRSADAEHFVGANDPRPQRIGFSVGKFKPHSEWYKQYEKTALSGLPRDTPRGRLVHSQVSNSTSLARNNLPLAEVTPISEEEGMGIPIATATHLSDSDSVSLAEATTSLESVPVAEATQVEETIPVIEAAQTLSAHNSIEPAICTEDDGEIWV